MSNNVADNVENATHDEFVDRPHRQFVEQPRNDTIRELSTNPHRPLSRGRPSSLRIDWPSSAIEKIRSPSVGQHPLTNSMEVGNAGWIVRANVFYDQGNGCVPEPSAAEDWEIGFIQNVLEDETLAVYQGIRNPIRLYYGGRRASRTQPPLLDTLPRSAVAWYLPQNQEILDGSGVALGRARACSIRR